MHENDVDINRVLAIERAAMAQVQLYVYDLSNGMAKAFSRMLLDKQVSPRSDVDVI